MGILVGLLILAVRPFGFRTFLIGLEHNNIYSLSLMICIVGIFLVILQRAGKSLVIILMCGNKNN